MRIAIIIADSDAEVDSATAGEEYRAHSVFVRDADGPGYTVRKSRSLPQGMHSAGLADMLEALAVQVQR